MEKNINKKLVKFIIILLFFLSYFITEKAINIIDYVKLPELVKSMDVVEKEAYLYVYNYSEVLNIYGVAYADKYDMLYIKWVLDSDCLYLIFLNVEKEEYQSVIFYDVKEDLLKN